MLQVIQAVSTNLPEFSTVVYYSTTAAFLVHLLGTAAGIYWYRLKSKPQFCEGLLGSFTYKENYSTGVQQYLYFIE